MGNFLDKLSDGELMNFAEQFYAKLNAAPATYGATTGQADDFKTSKNDYASDLTAHTAAQAAARAKTQTKEASRDALEAAIRFLIKQAKLNSVQSGNLADLGVPTEP